MLRVEMAIHLGDGEAAADTRAAAAWWLSQTRITIQRTLWCPSFCTGSSSNSSNGTIAQEAICGKEGGVREIQSREIVMGEGM